MEMDYEERGEFLAIWEKNHPRPEKKEALREWKKQREDALAHWSVAKEVQQNEAARAAEKETCHRRVMQHINSHILEEQYQMHVMKEPCYFPDAEPYKAEQFERLPLLSGMSGLTALACLCSFEQIGELVNTMSPALIGNLSFEDCDQIWKGLVAPHKAAYVEMRRACQCGKPEKIADLVKTAMQDMVKGALNQDWNYNRLIRFVGDQMVKTFYGTDDSRDPELRCFKDAFQKRDTEHVMQSFYALRRMTELSVLYQRSVEKLKDRTCENSYFTQQELRDFLVGSYVSNALKQSYAQKKLTVHALQFGEIQCRTNDAGAPEIIYGDEKLYQEIMRAQSYQQISHMKIGEIRKMLKKQTEAEKTVRKNPALEKTEKQNEGLVICRTFI